MAVYSSVLLLFSKPFAYSQLVCGRKKKKGQQKQNTFRIFYPPKLFSLPSLRFQKDHQYQAAAGWTIIAVLPPPLTTIEMKEGQCGQCAYAISLYIIIFRLCACHSLSFLSLSRTFKCFLAMLF